MIKENQINKEQKRKETVIAVIIALLSIVIGGIGSILGLLKGSTLVLNTATVFLGFLSAIAQVCVERPRLIFARFCLCIPAVSTAVILFMYSCLSDSQQKYRDEVARQTNLIVQRNETITEQLNQLLSYSIQDHNISDEDEILFLSFMRKRSPANYDLSVTKWHDGSFHLYWYENGKMCGGTYFTKKEIAEVMPMLQFGQEEQFTLWYSHILYSDENGENLWSPGNYVNGSMAGNMAFHIGQFFKHIGISIQTALCDEQRATLIFVLTKPIQKLIMKKCVVETEKGYAIEVGVDLLNSLKGKSIDVFFKTLIDWTNKNLGEEFLTEQQNGVLREWKSVGPCMIPVEQLNHCITKPIGKIKWVPYPEIKLDSMGSVPMDTAVKLNEERKQEKQ